MLQFAASKSTKPRARADVEKSALNETPEVVGIQDAVRSPRGSALSKYQDLVVGSRSLWKLLLYELVITFTSGVPGALGLVLRRIAYPWLLGSVGRNVTFGQGVVLRHPGKIHLGDDVVVDDLVMLDAKGTTNQGIRVGHGGFLGRGTILSCKNGDIELGDHVNIGFHSEVFSGSRVVVGRHGLFAAYTYLVGGGHEWKDGETPVIEQARTSRGITLGDNVWLGTGAKVLDGTRIGSNVVVGANAVVTGDLPDGVIAAGVPARVIKTREEPRPE
jgi:acetyltransferase-like isoleucine patch superfamily enzyme